MENDWQANREEIEAAVGGPTDDGLWEFRPWGTRCIVHRPYAKETASEDSLIIKPESAKDVEQLTTGEGWIIAVGQDCVMAKPGQHVAFDCYAGSGIQGNQQNENAYESLSIMMVEKDIWGENL